jgi:thioredoxin 1
VKIFDLTESNFNVKIAEGGIILIDCWAGWCEASKAFAPIFEQVAARFPRHSFAKIDSEVEDRLIKKLGVVMIPSLLLYRDGILLFKQPGYYEEEQLKKILHQAETLDMDLVRADIADEEQRWESVHH